MVSQDLPCRTAPRNIELRSLVPVPPWVQIEIEKPRYAPRFDLHFDLFGLLSSAETPLTFRAAAMNAWRAAVAAARNSMSRNLVASSFDKSDKTCTIY